MSRMKKDIGTGKNAGSNPVGREKSSNSYVIIDRCDKCPLYVFIDLVCEDNLAGLTIEGDPPEEVLKTAKTELISEYGELVGSGSGDFAMITQMHVIRNNLTGLSICCKLLGTEYANEAIAQAKLFGFHAPKDASVEFISKRMIGEIKRLDVRLRQETKRHESRTGDKRRGNVSKSQFLDQITILSKYYNFHIPTSITVMEYAGYVRNFKPQNYGKHNK